MGIFVCLEECYIYSIPGDDKGNPKDDADIVYDTVEDELLQLDVDRRNSNYVRCLLPKEGWVFLPNKSAQYNWGPLDAIINQKRREKEAQEEEEKGKQSDDKNKKEKALQADELRAVKS